MLYFPLVSLAIRIDYGIFFINAGYLEILWSEDDNPNSKCLGVEIDIIVPNVRIKFND